MDTNVLDIKSLLDVIFNVTKKNALILADQYLLKDVSIISKWKNHKVIPKDDDITKIVDFTICESTESQRSIIRDNIEDLIRNSLLKEDLKKIVLSAETFNEFLTEALNISTSTILYTKNSIQSITPYTCEAREDELDCNNKKYLNTNYLEIDLPDNIEGKYTGIINFDLILFNAKEGRGKNVVRKLDMNLIVVSTSLVKQNEKKHKKMWF